ncbi:49_t:CDS:1, partial [Entrophospora sp. SA101]
TRNCVRLALLMFFYIVHSMINIFPAKRVKVRENNKNENINRNSETELDLLKKFN